MTILLLIVFMIWVDLRVNQLVEEVEHHLALVEPLRLMVRVQLQSDQFEVIEALVLIALMHFDSFAFIVILGDFKQILWDIVHPVIRDVNILLSLQFLFGLTADELQARIYLYGVPGHE